MKADCVWYRLDASAGLLTNFEVLEVLKERGTRTEADESGVPGPATPSEQKVSFCTKAHAFTLSGIH